MNRNLKRILYISGLTIAAISFSQATTASAHQTTAAHHYINTSINRSSMKKVNNILYNKGYKLGNHTSNYFYTKIVTNYEGKIAPYIAASLMKSQAPVYNTYYKHGYIRGYNNIANHPRHGGSFDRQNHGYTLSNNRYNQALRLYTFFRNKSTAYRKGFQNYVKANYNGNGFVTPPKKYRSNLDYAKGYLLQNTPSITTLSDMDKLFNENQYENYRSSHGHINYESMLSPHYKYLYHLYWNMLVYEEHNALTLSQSKQFEQRYKNHYHLNHNDRKFFDYLFTNLTDEGMGYNGYTSYDSGGYLWRGTGFAKNLIKKAPFHHNVYYSKWAVNVADGPLSKSTAYDGVILGLRGNNTNTARHTASIFNQYLVNEYYTKPKKQNKALIKYFKQNYKIKSIVTAKHIWGHKIDYTKGVSIYHIYNRKLKHSTIAYYIPTGKGPIGWIPDING